MYSRIRAIAKKEIKQLIRDKRMVFVLFFFPVFLLGVFGYVVDFDVQNVKLAVLDNSKSETSREFVNSLSSSDYFDIVLIIKSEKEIKTILDEKEAQAVLVIPSEFVRKLYGKKEEARLQFLIDGTNGNTASIIQNYVASAVQSFNAKIQKEMLAQAGAKSFQPIALEPIFMFNKDLKSARFLIPGLIAMILILVSVVSVSLSLVREKERGTIEQINVSSLSTLELLIGKAMPYVVISLINAAFIIFAGYLLFDVAVKGSYMLLFISTLIFIFSSVSLGIFISVVSDSQQVAFTMATFATLLPSLVLSGFIFPIESMPPIIQAFTNITPAKFFIVSLRAIMLRGVGLPIFWEQLVYLLLFTVLFLGLATVMEKKRS
ncbi:MAG: ABC transporter permease [Ignavibacteriae bacterium]|nr:ABC transporter permease [Ignavibacteriota bacterium]NOG98094.1 ABC transporter permease [Ignavibacteriota bacterium]